MKLREFVEALEQQGLIVKTDVMVLSGRWQKMYADLAVYYSEKDPINPDAPDVEHLLAVFEIKSGLSSKRSNVKIRVRRMVESSGATLGVILTLPPSKPYGPDGKDYFKTGEVEIADMEVFDPRSHFTDVIKEHYPDYELRGKRKEDWQLIETAQFIECLSPIRKMIVGFNSEDFVKSYLDMIENILDGQKDKSGKSISLENLLKCINEFALEQELIPESEYPDNSYINKTELRGMLEKISEHLRQNKFAKSITNDGFNVFPDLSQQSQLVWDMIYYDKNGHFRNDNDDKALIDGACFCRFTSVNRLFSNINDGEESMLGLAGMNDKMEGLFLNKCLGNHFASLTSLPPDRLEKYNTNFILSLCEESKKDDLTMWRLYGGNDGDGVSLIYGISDVAKLRSNKNFILAPISYGSNNMVVKFFLLLKVLAMVSSLNFVLKMDSIWNFFVKDEGFKVEEEWRLLYINSSIAKAAPAGVEYKWIYNDNCGIVHPLVIFKKGAGRKGGEDNRAIVKFPLVLKEIILGPKCKESGVNSRQLEQFLKLKGLNIAVSISRHGPLYR